MTGSDAYLPIMADCERGMGRPERALDLVRSPEAERLDRAGRIELSIVESGARRDLGQNDAAVITLQRLPELRDSQPKPWSARLAFAYADALAEAGHQEAATDWFARAMAFDEDGETEAAERYAELTGAVIEDVEEEFDDEDGDYEDDFDDAGASVATPDGDDTVDDAEAVAEADDLLEGPVEESAELADDSSEGEAEAAQAAAVPNDAPAGAEPDATLPEAEDDKASNATGGPEQDGPADAEQDEVSGTTGGSQSDDVRDEPQRAGRDAVSDGPADAQPGDPADVSSAAPAEKPETVEEPGVPSITPAFIEPDFGDILDQPDEDSQDTSKRDK